MDCSIETVAHGLIMVLTVVYTERGIDYDLKGGIEHAIVWRWDIRRIYCTIANVYNFT